MEPPETPGRFTPTLFAVSSATGQKLWSWHTPGRIYTSQYSALAIADDVAFVNSNATVYAVEPGGLQGWQASIPATESLSSAPTVAGDVVYVGGDGQSGQIVVALNAATGAPIWTATLTSAAGSCTQPAFDAEIVYVSCGDSTLYALNAKNGVTLWSFTSADEYGLGLPTVSAGHVYVSDLHGDATYVLNERTGHVLWRHTTGGPIGTSPVVADGVDYVSCTNGVLYALSAGTGAVKWTATIQPASYMLADSPTAANGVVYILSVKAVVALQAATGRKLWSSSDGNGGWSPVVVNGMLYSCGPKGGIERFILDRP